MEPNEPSPNRDPLRRLIERLRLVEESSDAFVGSSGPGEGNLFGGFIAAQATMAAARTAGERALHSLHAYFLRPGHHGEAIRYSVERLRDGRNFSTRRVTAWQRGSIIFTLTADFTVQQDGLAHQTDGLPVAPAPDGLPDWEDVRAELLGPQTARRLDGPIEVRMCDVETPNPGEFLEPRRRVWLRPRGVAPAEPHLHAALIVYTSDRTLLRTAARAHGLGWRLGVGASLDHAVWFHRPAHFDDWLLYASDSPVAHAGRAWIKGAMYRPDGTRVVSVVQEGLLRVR